MCGKLNTSTDKHVQEGKNNSRLGLNVTVSYSSSPHRGPPISLSRFYSEMTLKSGDFETVSKPTERAL